MINKSKSGVKQAIIRGALLRPAGFTIGVLHGKKNEVSPKTTESYLVSIVFKNNKSVIIECNKYEYVNFITLKNKLKLIDEFVEVEEIAEPTEEKKKWR